MAVASNPSPALLAANERLLELRAQAQAGRQPAVSPAAALNGADGSVTGAAVPPWLKATRELPSLDDFLADRLPKLSLTLPGHLGWGSEPLTQALRQAQVRQQTEPVSSARGRVGQAAASSGAGNDDYNRQSAALSFAEPGNGRITRPKPSTALKPAPEVKLYSDIGLAMLRQEQTAAGRLWLLLRSLDDEGRGWLRVVNIRPLLTQKTTNTYLCGWRQLRNLLREGEGLYWTRDKERIWLRSAAKVAFGLGIERLGGRPVALPLEALVNGIGRFRAELYAAFHSGRVKVTPGGEEQAAPIARETLTTLSGVGETTQRRYEAQLSQAETAVRIQPNFAIGHKASQVELESKGWQQGNALFTLEDFHGQQGPKGEQYVAWQLPNSYTGSHQHRPKGRQRRINRFLARAARNQDLVMKGMPGNVGQTVEARQPDTARDKLYYPTGKQAAQAFNRRKTDNCYWRQRVTRNGRYAIWQHLEQTQRRGAGSHH